MPKVPYLPASSAVDGGDLLAVFEQATGFLVKRRIDDFGGTVADATARAAAAAAQATANAAIPKATVTTKGDILVATASGTVIRLAAGSNGQVIVADSGQASGIKWATPESGLTVNSTTVSGASAGDLLISDGTKLQKLTPGAGVAASLLSGEFTDPDARNAAAAAQSTADAAGALAATKSKLLRGSGTLLGGSLTPQNAVATLSFNPQYAGGTWTLVLDGTEYPQPQTTATTNPGALTGLPGGWSYDSGAGTVTATATGSGHTASRLPSDRGITLGAGNDGDDDTVHAGQELVFDAYDGGIWDLTINGTIYAQAATTAGAAPGSANLPAGYGWTVDGNTATVSYDTDFSSGHVIDRGSTPPSVASFTDGADADAVTEAELVALSAGKTTLPGGLSLYSDDGLDAEWAISLKTAGPTYTDLITGTAIAAGVNMLLAPDRASRAAYLAGAADAALVVRMTGDVPDSGDLTVMTESTTQV